MYQFPDQLYTDVRIETVYKTECFIENLLWKENKTRKEVGAFIRIFDGNHWYYNATTEIDHIQEEINQLSSMAQKNKDIKKHPIVSKMEINQGTFYFDLKRVIDIKNEEKVNLLESYKPLLSNIEGMQISRMGYLDNYTEKKIYSSLGTNLSFDMQNASIIVGYTLLFQDIPHDGSAYCYEMSFDKLQNRQEELKEKIQIDIDYAKHAVPVVPGNYTCILSPETAGVFAHESFGHKSEADFMVGDETMKREWAIGSKVGAPLLNIIDYGALKGSGYVPFDDEGCKAKETYLVRNGILAGRLHSAATAAALQEEATANARAVSFEYEPIVRMTATYIGAGDESKEDLFHSVKEGIYIDSIRHGSGMSTFTIAPQRAYFIRDGKIAEPVRVSVVTGNVMTTLNEIDGVSDTIELKSFPRGGCGKMEQFPLRVGFGGPYVRVRTMEVK